MKRITSIATVLLASACFSGTAFSQKAYEAQVEYDKEKRTGVVAEYNVEKKTVEEALKERLEKAGLGKPKSSKGFLHYPGVVWKDISTEKIDVYTRVEGKKDNAVVSVLISKGYDNFITSGNDGNIIQNTKKFLDNFNRDITVYQLQLDINKQEAMVKKAEKEYQSSVDKGKDLATDKERLEKKIADNETEQKSLQKELEKAKTALDGLKRRE